MPVEGVIIGLCKKASPHEIVVSTTTGVDGKYEFNGVLPDEYEVGVDSTGFQGAAETPSTISTSTTTNSVENIDFTVSGDRTISGVVKSLIHPAATHHSFVFVEGATVILKERDGTNTLDTLETVATGSDGKYEFTGVIPGTFTVEVETVPDGYNLPAIDLQPHLPTTDRIVDVDTTTGSVDDADFRTTGTRSISGRVMLQQAGSEVMEPIHKAFMVLSYKGRTFWYQETDNTGRYEFTGLTPAGYLLRADLEIVYDPDITTTPLKMNPSVIEGNVELPDFVTDGVQTYYDRA